MPHLFGNVIMRKVIQFKWDKYAKRLFIYELLIFTLYLALFLTFTLLLVPLNSYNSFSDVLHDNDGLAAAVITFIIPFFCIRALYLEFRQLQAWER